MSPSINHNAVEIVLDNKLGYERVAMACAASFAKMMGFSDERIEDLKTMVAEAAINAIQHGNKDHPDAKVAMSMNFGDGRPPHCRGRQWRRHQGLTAKARHRPYY